LRVKGLRPSESAQEGGIGRGLSLKKEAKKRGNLDRGPRAIKTTSNTGPSVVEKREGIENRPKKTLTSSPIQQKEESPEVPKKKINVKGGRGSGGYRRIGGP